MRQSSSIAAGDTAWLPLTRLHVIFVICDHGVGPYSLVVVGFGLLSLQEPDKWDFN